MDPYFEGKKVIVTGAGKGIGRQLCVTLATLGAKVIAISRTTKDLENLRQENASIEIHNQDISDWSSTRKLIEDIGLVDMLVNNAAVDRKKPYLEITEDDFDYIYNTNVKAVFNISQAVIKCMIEKNSCGSIVNVSSIAGINPVHFIGTYGCTKAALDMMTKTMAIEFGPHKIRVNSVNPTVVMTKMGRAAWSAPGVADSIISKIPTGRFAEEIDVVNAIVFLLSDKASMINGIQMPVDGAHHMNFMKA